jgi:SNF2-related domain/HNH endonuclease/Helicase conserved C-terminal domain
MRRRKVRSGTLIREYRQIAGARRFIEVVHHKDGNPYNNDPSNLEVMTPEEHRKLHNQGKDHHNWKGGIGVKYRARVLRMYRPKTPMWPHQKRALQKLVRQRGGALFIPMRGGKTKIVVDFCAVAEQAWGARRVLVVCPLSAVGVWHREIEKHLPEESDLQFYVTNYERLYDRRRNGRSWVPVDRAKLIQWVENAKTIAVVDESHRLANPTSVQSKKAWHLGQHANWRVIMTGTPYHRKPLGIFGQMRFLDDRVLGTSYGAFKRQYAVFGGYGNFVVKRYINLPELRKKVYAKAYVMRHIPKHKPTITPVPVPLSPKAVSAYRDMQRESLLLIKKAKREHVATAPIALTRALRLAQIAGGWVRDEDGNYHRVHTDLRDAFRDWLGDRHEEGTFKLVVYARFRPELKDVAEVCKSVGYDILLMHGGITGPKREQRIAEFDETDKPTIFIAQVAAGAEGIDLSASRIAVYYSPPQSLVQWDQSHARIRKWRDKEARGYYYFIPELPDRVPSVTGITITNLRVGRELADYMVGKPETLFRT